MKKEDRRFNVGDKVQYVYTDAYKDYVFNPTTIYIVKAIEEFEYSKNKIVIDILSDL